MKQSDEILRKLTKTIETTITNGSVKLSDILMSPPADGGTPIDTGWASANWIIGESSPVRVDGNQPKDNIELEVSSRKRLSDASKAKIKTGYTIKNGDVFVSNNAPYIGELNEGSSRQAPRAFVQAAMNKAASIANGRN